MKFTYKQLERVLFDGSIESEGKVIKLVEEGEWKQLSKEQEKQIIFTDGQKYYKAYVGRYYSQYDGDWSYYSEHFYDGAIDEHVAEVKKKKKKKAIETFE